MPYGLFVFSLPSLVLLFWDRELSSGLSSSFYPSNDRLFSIYSYLSMIPMYFRRLCEIIVGRSLQFESFSQSLWLSMSLLS